MVEISQRRISLILLGLICIGSFLLLIAQLVTNPAGVLVIPLIFSCLIYAGLTFAYWRGWEYARHVMVVIITILTGISLPEPFVTGYAPIAILLPSILALILTSPRWVVGSAAILYTILLVRAGGIGIYIDPLTFLVFVMTTGGIILSRLMTDAALHKAEISAAEAKANATQAEESRKIAERQAQEAEQQTVVVQQQYEQQRQLLELVATLETPAVTLADGVLLAPIIGNMDSRRAQALTSRLLHTVTEQRARLVILDIAGVLAIDTAVAKALLDTSQALRLVGCQVKVTGISAAVAMTLTQLGAGLEGIDTARSPQDVLAQGSWIATSPVSPTRPTQNGIAHGPLAATKLR